MKKWLIGLLTAGMLFSLAACKTSETKETKTTDSISSFSEAVKKGKGKTVTFYGSVSYTHLTLPTKA